MNNLIYSDESYRIIGACMKVHSDLGPGFLEAVYQEALGTEMNEQNISYKEQVKLPVFYKGKPLKKYYRVDFLCFNKIIVELKASSYIIPAHSAQLLNYLKATGMKLGLLINFGNKSLEVKRVINSV